MYKPDEDGHGTGAPPPSDRIGPAWALTATRRTRGQTGSTGAYSRVSLFSLLSLSSRSSSFWLSLLPQSTAMIWAGQDRTNLDGDRNAGPDGEGGGSNGYALCFLVCLFSSIFLPTLLFFFYNDLFCVTYKIEYNSRHDVMGQDRRR